MISHPTSRGSIRVLAPPSLVGAILMEQNDEWAVQRARYMTLETMMPLRDTAFVSLPEMTG